MADQLHDANEGMSEECNKETDVKDVLHCDPCKDDGIQLEAVRFCVDCNDYLCTECHQAHKRNKLSRNHVLTNTDNIPKSKPKKQRTSEQCQEHQTEPINWYCKFHDKCICAICKQVYHRNCMDVKPITDLSQDFLSSGKIKEVTNRVTQLLKAFDERMLRITENTESVKSYYATAIEEVIRNISKIRNEDLEKMKALEVTCDATMQTIRSVLNEIETLQQHDEADQAFISTRKAESQLKDFDDRLESIENVNKITKYRYVCEPMGKEEGAIGKMFAGKDRFALNIDNLDVKTSTDKPTCDYTSIEKLSENKFGIADYINAKIKLVDMTSKAVITELKLDWKPYDLTRIDDNMIAVTTFDTKKILFVSISDTETVHKTIDKSEFHYCLGIVYSNNTLIVSYRSPSQIQIMNLDGTIKQVIENKDAHGNVRFGDVWYMTQGPDKNILYLSDWSGQKVSRMNLDGQVISSFTHEDLKDPRGITVGKDGRIFVCSYGTNKIFEISSDFAKGQVILDEQDGITQPCSILFDDYRLYVGSSQKNLIQVFMI